MFLYTLEEKCEIQSCASDSGVASRSGVEVSTFSNFADLCTLTLASSRPPILGPVPGELQQQPLHTVVYTGR